MRFTGRLFDRILPGEAARAATTRARVAIPPHAPDAEPSIATIDADLAAAGLDRALPPAVFAIVTDLMARLVAADAEAGAHRP